jgi:hypothetical protein
MSHAARRRSTPTTPIRVGRTWLFSDGRMLPVIAGGADDETVVTVPEDLTLVEAGELADLEDALVAEFDRMHDEGSDDLARMTEIADALDRVRVEGKRREDEKAEAAQKAAELRSRVHGEAKDDGDDDEGDDPGDGDAPAGDGGEGAKAEDKEPALTAAAPKPISVPRKASASATTRRAGRPTVDGRVTQPIVITAAADLPGVSTGAVIDIAQVAQSLHDKARALSNGSPRVPIARFNLSFEHEVKKGMTADQQAAIVEAATAQTALVASGGWCVPSENMYDLFALDGQTGLLDLPTVGVTRGGINIPGYIGMDAADGALWDWSEDQDEAVTITISDLDATGGTATVTTSAAHLLEVGDLVVINSSSGNVNGPVTVATVADSTHFTYATVGTPTVSNATGYATRQKGVFRIPCPSWTDYRLAGYGATIEHGNLTDQAFPELTRRYVQLALNAHAHRMSVINLAKIKLAGNADSVTVTAAGSDSFGEVVNAIELSAVDYRSEHKMSSNVILEVLMPVWIRENIRTTLAMRAGVDLLAVSDQQIDAYLAARKIRPQFLEDDQPMWNGTRRQAWPTSAVLTMYPAGNFIEGKGKTIDLGVVRDSRLNATNDFTAMWTEEFSLLGRRGPKARLITVTLSTDGVTACCA